MVIGFLQRRCLMDGNFEFAWDVLQVLLVIGFMLGVIAAVVGGAFKIGSQFAWVVVVIAAIVWFMS